jgi:hypothetical protein
MVNAGQVCLAAKRVYAPRAIYDDLCDALGDLARAAVVGDGLDQGSQIGPVQNAAQYAKLVDYLAEAREQGRIVAGGAPIEREGYFIAPTIVRDLPDDARLVREEQFGPVLPVLAYDDLDQAVAAINASDYGLGGTIWTGNPNAANRWPCGSTVARSGSTVISICLSTWRSAGPSNRASGVSRAWRVCSNSHRPKSSTSPRVETAQPRGQTMTQPFVRPDVAAFLAAGQASGDPAINELPVAEARAAIRAMGQALDLPPEPLAVVRDLACGEIPLRLYDMRETREAGR